jgi:hypothetical protein
MVNPLSGVADALNDTGELTCCPFCGAVTVALPVVHEVDADVPVPAELLLALLVGRGAITAYPKFEFSCAATQTQKTIRNAVSTFIISSIEAKLNDWT